MGCRKSRRHGAEAASHPYLLHAQPPDYSLYALPFALLSLCPWLCVQVWQVSPKTKPKTYSFFYVGDAIAGARSSAGGVALLVKGRAD